MIVRSPEEEISEDLSCNIFKVEIISYLLSKVTPYDYTPEILKNNIDEDWLSAILPI